MSYCFCFYFSFKIDALLRLVKEEQKIYNIIFNEVIRQVSVDCIERGTVLAELRKRYAKMLDRVPRQVKRYVGIDCIFLIIQQ